MSVLRLTWDDAAVSQAYLALSDRMATKYLRRAVKAAAMVTYPVAFQAVPVDTGKLLGTLKLNTARVRRKGLAVAYSVGTFAPRGTGGKDASLYRGDTFYGGFQEYGWTVGKRKGGKGSGTYGSHSRASEQTVGRKVPGKHYLLHAFESTSGQALDVMLNGLVDGLEQATREVARAYRRATRAGVGFNASRYLSGRRGPGGTF